jgi:hypothetical protein
MVSQEYQPHFKLDVPLPDCRQETPLLSLSLPTESETRPLTVWVQVVTLRTTMFVIKKSYLVARVHVCVMIVTVNSISRVLSGTASGLTVLHVRAMKMLHTDIMNHYMHFY